MGRFGHLHLAVWREACRHIEIGDAVAQSAPTLFGGLPIDAVLIRRFDSARQHVETVATGVCRSDIPSLQPRNALDAPAWHALIEWCRKGRAEFYTAAQMPQIASGLLPPGLTGDVLAGPLCAEEGPIGLALFAARSSAQLRPRHARVLQMLLEPFTAWLENDRRLRELKTLSEAAAADNRSLLSRLNRNDITDSIVGAEAGLRQVLERVDQVSRTDVPVLILGETGSGKEVVARAIHQRSLRAAGPFLRVNCGAISPELVDSELFGHERGSFTGAVGQRKGWFERADGGTLFLDECGELSLAAQVRLLRILQDGVFERVGGEKQVSVNVRVIAATHRDLQLMTREKHFREDLWYRLAVFPIRLPPLRERTQDVAALARHFAERSAQRLGIRVLLPSPDDIEALRAYAWPGNVRELAAVIERAVILGEGKRLEIAKALGPVEPPAPRVRIEGPQTELAPHWEFASLDAAMAGHIEAALRRSHGRIEGPFGAAHLLKINPHTLRGRMRSLGIDWRRFRNGRTPADFQTLTHQSD
jgi:transcriptional regulator with GAF, ATPase, and Fis domain